MNENDPSVTRLFQGWHAEDRAIASRINRLREWMKEVNQLGVPHFGETSHALRMLREALLDHFSHERALSGQLNVPNPKSLAAQTEVELPDDQEKILAELMDLIDRLGQLEPPFESWRAAMDEVDQVVALVEQHERLEQHGVESLMSATNRPKPE